MFGFFRQDPLKKLEAQYARLLEQARDLQRQGDIQAFAQKSAEADAVLQEIQALETERQSTQSN